MAHPNAVKNLREAVARLGSGASAIDIVLVGSTTPQGLTVDEVIRSSLNAGLSKSLKPSRFEPGESRRRIAFLCFSSGTTGPPKVSFSSPYSRIRATGVLNCFPLSCFLVDDKNRLLQCRITTSSSPSRRSRRTRAWATQGSLAIKLVSGLGTFVPVVRSCRHSCAPVPF